ncbi:MAG: hypothetical protein AB7E47_09090 [Desulfovibrionaceae bacterium]
MGLSHWDHFLELEREFARLTRDIGYTSAYYSVHSAELADCIETCCATFHTTAVLLGKTIDPTARLKTIDDCRPVILGRYPHFTSYKIMIPSYNMAVAPWADWTATAVPGWWADYRALRENRAAHLRKANYWNAIYATAGLLCGICYYHKAVYADVCTIHDIQSPRIFIPKQYGDKKPDWAGWCYTLPEEAAAEC